MRHPRSAPSRGVFATLRAALASLLTAAAAWPQEAPKAPADWVFLGGRVETMCADFPVARALAVRGSLIAYVGDEAGARSWIGAETRVVDLADRLLLPGFHDSHVHPLVGELESSACALYEVPSIEELADTIRRWAASHPDAPWIRGGGWELPLFEEEGPTRELLDRLVGARPAALYSADGHSLWLNSEALRRVGIDSRTPDPPGGRIERDDTGRPSGVLREAAMELAEDSIPPYSPREYLAAGRRAMRRMASFGITSAQDAEVDEDLLAAYAELAEAGELTTRIRACVAVDIAHPATEVERVERLRRANSGRGLRVEAVKVYADGVVEARTAALLEPYSDGVGGRGPETPTRRELRVAVAAFEAAGLQVHVHAIGDRAIRWSLDAIEASPGHAQARHHLAHLQVLHPEDRARFAELGVVADFQPLWAYPNDYLTGFSSPALGAERMRWTYRIADLVGSDAVVCFGSDWTVSSMDPFLGIQVALTRADPDSPESAALMAEQRIGLSEALRAYTAAGAWAAFDEEHSGTLEVGKRADLIVVDRDLFELRPEHISEASVELTLAAGREVYRAR